MFDVSTVKSLPVITIFTLNTRCSSSRRMGVCHLCPDGLLHVLSIRMPKASAVFPSEERKDSWTCVLSFSFFEEFVFE